MPTQLHRRFLTVPGDIHRLQVETILQISQLRGDTFDWSDVLQRRLVAVLGEAGTGKTTEFRTRASELASEGAAAFFVRIEDLADEGLSSSLDLADEERLRQFVKGKEPGYFFLDSVDEAKLRGKSVPNALKKLGRELRPALDRCHLFVSCRVSDWRVDEDHEELAKLAPYMVKGEQPPVTATLLQLAPLSEEQVLELADFVGVTDLDAFGAAISDSSAQVFVERPRDVEWLARYWRERGELGALRDLVDHNVDNKLTDHGNRPRTLSPQKLREGATTLAAASVLTATAAFALPTGGLTSTGGALSPKGVLPDWSQDHIAELLACGLFDEATYGRVRIHHRTVQEFLAAEWFAAQLQNGMPRRSLHGLLFRISAGETVVPPHLQEVAAWLALSDAAVRNVLTEHHPEVLLGSGDPHCLSPENRARVLGSYSDAYTDRQRLYHSFDRASLGRFASPTLASTINEILGEPTTPQELATTLLSLVTEGRIAACVPVALTLALDATRTEDIRFHAVRAVGEAGGPDERQQVVSQVLSESSIPADLAGSVVRWYFPEHLSTVHLVALLQRVEDIPHNYTSSLNHVLEHDLVQEATPEQLSSLLRALMATFCGELVTASHWILRTIAKLAAAAVDVLPADDEALVGALEYLRPHRHEYLRGMNDLREAIAGNAEVRRALFWRRVETEREDSGRIPTRYFDLNDIYRLYELGPNDFDWLAHDSWARPTVQERLLAFDALTRIPFPADQQPKREGVLRDLGARDEALQKRLSRMLNPPHYGRPWDQRWERHARALELRAQRRKEQNQRNLDGTVEQIRTGKASHNLCFLLEQVDHAQNEWSKVDIGPIRELYGDAVAEAAEEGWKAIWRDYDPPLPHERPERNQTPYAAVMGIVGLTLDVRDGLDPSSLTPEDARRAIKFAACELNGFPAWATVIATSTPDLVCEVLEPAIAADMLHDEDVNDVLAKLPWASAPIKKAVAPSLVRLLQDNQPRGQALRQSLETLISIDAPPTNEVFERGCSKSTDNPAIFALWWTAWMNVDWEHATSFLEQQLAQESDESTQALLLAACARLETMRQGVMSTIRPTWVESHQPLECLIPVAHEYIRHEDDVSHVGTYSPSERDDAQSFRNRLLNYLAQVEGQESVEAFRRLAEDHRMLGLRDWLLHQAESRLAGNQECAPMNPGEARHWMRSFNKAIGSSVDLMAVTINVLDELRFEIELGDNSYRDLFNPDLLDPAAKRITEEPVQNWLASQLNNAARGRYTVSREEEVDHKKRPDIRTNNPLCEGPVSIEVKIAERWSYNTLTDALCDQLVGQYLKAVSSNHGILLLASAGSTKRWVPDDGRQLTFPELVEALNQEASRVADAEPALNLLVFGLDLH